MIRLFPAKVVSLEISLSADQMNEETAERIRETGELCELPSLRELANVLSSSGLPKSLSEVDKGPRINKVVNDNQLSTR
jgi:hypothetical protein